MSKKDLELLDYLHDATVEEIAWSHVQNSKVLRMTFFCNEGCEHADWARKRVTVTFNDVLMVSSTLFGYVLGQDMFNAYKEEVSQNMLDSLQKLMDAGVSPPKIRLRLALHSGSELQLACASITIDVAAP